MERCLVRWSPAHCACDILILVESEAKKKKEKSIIQFEFECSACTILVTVDDTRQYFPISCHVDNTIITYNSGRILGLNAEGIPKPCELIISAQSAAAGHSSQLHKYPETSAYLFHSFFSDLQ
jgi:hypothetical protein